MTIKEIMKNVEKQNALRKELKQDELVVKFSESLCTYFSNKTYTTYKALEKEIKDFYVEGFAQGILNTNFEYADGSFINVGCTITIK